MVVLLVTVTECVDLACCNCMLALDVLLSHNQFLCRLQPQHLMQQIDWFDDTATCHMAH